MPYVSASADCSNNTSLLDHSRDLTDHPQAVFDRIMHRNIFTTGTGTTMTRLRERVAG